VYYYVATLKAGWWKHRRHARRGAGPRALLSGLIGMLAAPLPLGCTMLCDVISAAYRVHGEGVALEDSMGFTALLLLARCNAFDPMAFLSGVVHLFLTGCRHVNLVRTAGHAHTPV
jgi:hypothetical protein